MEIGKIISCKRKELGMTQAQVADYLGVTAPAVNRWEKDLSVPDAGLMAPIARLLKIDMNELFSFYDSLSDIEIWNIKNKIISIFFAQKYEELIEYIDQQARENPSDAKLFICMAETTESLYLFVPTDETKSLIRKSIELYERSAELDPSLNDRVQEGLIKCFNRLGEYEKADACWRKVEGEKAIMHIHMLEGQEKHKQAAAEMKAYVLNDLYNVACNLGELKMILGYMGNTYESNLAREKELKLIELFGLWEGIFAFEKYEQDFNDNNKEKAPLSSEFLDNLKSPQPVLSSCELFKDVIINDTGSEERNGGYFMQKIINSLKKESQEE
nr:helix-turn-helix transcriptional regulator [Clostridia bacterium]